MNRFENVSLVELRRAVVIKEQITALESELAAILGTPSPRGRGKARRGRPPMGNGHQRGMKPGRGRGGRRGWKLNPRARAKLRAAARARWAKAKAAGRNSL